MVFFLNVKRMNFVRLFTHSINEISIHFSNLHQPTTVMTIFLVNFFGFKQLI